ncbi:MAG: sigma 54-interacting transcriptional regulator, partial [Caldimicrobium sp.]
MYNNTKYFFVNPFGSHQPCHYSPTRSLSPPSTVLILGESGTGKEVLARYLHFCSQ